MKYWKAFSVMVCALALPVVLLFTYIRVGEKVYYRYNNKKSVAELEKDVEVVDSIMKQYRVSWPEDIKITRMESRTFRRGMGTITETYIYSNYGLEDWEEYLGEEVTPLTSNGLNGGAKHYYDTRKDAYLLGSPGWSKYVEAKGIAMYDEVFLAYFKPVFAIILLGGIPWWVEKIIHLRLLKGKVGWSLTKRN